MNYHLDHSTLTVDDQQRQFVFNLADSSTVFLTFEKLGELNIIVHNINEETARRQGQEWTGIKVYRNSPSIPVDIELISNIMTNIHIAFQVEDSVHPEQIQVRQKDVEIAVGILNRIGYETNKDVDD